LLCRDDSPDFADQVRADASSSVLHLALCSDMDITVLKELLAFKFFPVAALVDGACNLWQTCNDVTSVSVFSLGQDF
jgi:hypothetical protein